MAHSPTLEIGQEKTEKCITGYTYDELMLKHACPWAPEHQEGPHRLRRLLDRLKELSLLDRCQFIRGRLATEDEVFLNHSRAIVEKLKQAPVKLLDENHTELKKFCQQYDDVYLNEYSYELALLAIGNCLELLDSVMSGKCRNGFALVRPPGHHAMHNEPNGYCLLNNVACTAKQAIEKYKAQRVLIVDWDVHHGQGSQYAFYDTNKVLYISTHRYEYGDFWPKLLDSDFDQIGKDQGKGYNINIPLNKYDPDLVLISAGYDVAIGCPEGEMLITPDTFAHLTHYLKGLANGKVLVLLEGGYCPQTLAESGAWTLRSLLGDPCSPLLPCKNPDPITLKTVACCKHVLKPFWKSLAIDNTDGSEFWIEEAKRKRSLFPLNTHTDANRRAEYPLTPLLNTPLSKEKQQILDKKIQQALDIGKHTQPHERGRTLLVYDEKMLKYNAEWHVERPGRITAIWEGLRRRHLSDRCLMVDSRYATKEEILLAHNDEFYEKQKSIKTMTVDELEIANVEAREKSLIYSTDLFDNALLAAGSCLNLVDAVMEGKGQNGFAVVRPPGHHAHCSQDSGFCYFNNVAIVARYLQKKYGIKKILIADFDYHMGDGTKDIFYDDPSVLYMSLHCEDAFPPNEGSETDFGIKNGQGFNVNIGWKYFRYAAHDGDYIHSFHHIILPIAYEFAPEIVLVSAGFDAAEGDRVGYGKLSAVSYSQMTHMLLSLAGGRVIEILEGGYNLTQLDNCASACVSALLGDIPLRCTESTMRIPQKEVSCLTIPLVKDVHRTYWTSLFRVPTEHGDESDVTKSIEDNPETIALQLEKHLTITKVVEEHKFRNLALAVRQAGGLGGVLKQLYRNDEVKDGDLIGVDKYGNRYYQNLRYFVGRSRWVIYADHVGLDYDASQIPPEWHRWLQYIGDNPPTEQPYKRYPWMIDNIENKTGTSQIYVPYTTVQRKVQSWMPPKSQQEQIEAGMTKTK
ncbi:unnamed protein product [Didymodactylos carnosus]|uniref:Histone deacetylase domain-containing protein n=1 Tax=Didymodactylos carnosus TaxID=1234261 RepID=A0A814BJ75_9BILA|nr:unnamed protein product [Didymodactylos carnosus]CAF0930061.1 unnamed protein product [Didymodactylos carnosus]CAF3533569.1 unnamed protein product [Didymodactylos carnosus]CAF3708126.1 unnamed protein product [Didymodactylos carnosus]